MTNTTNTATEAEHIIPLLRWGAPLHVTLRDGSERVGALKFRSRRGFTTDDSIHTISYSDVASLSVAGVQLIPRP